MRHRTGLHRRIGWLLVLTAVAVPPGLAQSADQSAEFGRFFTRPGTRAELNRARESYSVERPAERSRAEEPAPPQQVRLNGVVLRSDGEGQVWINNAADAGRSGTVESVSIDTSRPDRPLVAVTLPGGRRVKLRPGEIFSLESGQIRDSFQRKGAARDQAAGQDAEPAGEQDNRKAGADTDEQTEQFDESELVDRDFRILLLEKRLEKLESSIKTPGQDSADSDESAAE